MQNELSIVLTILLNSVSKWATTGQPHEECPPQHQPKPSLQLRLVVEVPDSRTAASSWRHRTSIGLKSTALVAKQRTLVTQLQSLVVTIALVMSLSFSFRHHCGKKVIGNVLSEVRNREYYSWHFSKKFERKIVTSLPYYVVINYVVTTGTDSLKITNFFSTY